MYLSNPSATRRKQHKVNLPSPSPIIPFILIRLPLPFADNFETFFFVFCNGTVFFKEDAPYALKFVSSDLSIFSQKRLDLSIS